MTNRVLLGNRSGTYGLFVSGPGYDVTTCDATQLTFDSTAGFGQIMQQGSVSGASTVTFTNWGFIPLAFVSTANLVGNSIRLWPCTATSITFTGSGYYFLVRPS